MEGAPQAMAEGVPVVIEVAAGLLFSGDRLLIAQRPSGTHLAGFWEFPGGKLDPGEDWDTCLRRELSEELGIQVQVGPLFEEVTHTYPTKTVRLRFLICTQWEGEPSPIGCAALEWISREQLGHFKFPPADERLIARLQTEPWPLSEG